MSYRHVLDAAESIPGPTPLLSSIAVDDAFEIRDVRVDDLTLTAPRLGPLKVRPDPGTSDATGGGAVCAHHLHARTRPHRAPPLAPTTQHRSRSARRPRPRPRPTPPRPSCSRTRAPEASRPRCPPSRSTTLRSPRCPPTTRWPRRLPPSPARSTLSRCVRVFVAMYSLPLTNTPACVPACLPAYLLACLSACLPVCLSACLPVCLSAC
jgi:hypothetical protein